MKIDNEKILNSLAFNMKIQYISKYSVNLLSSTTFGHENTLFWNQSNGKMLDSFLKNCRIDGNNSEFASSSRDFFTEIAEASILCSSLRYSSTLDDIDLDLKIKESNTSLSYCLTNRKSERNYLDKYIMNLKTLAELLNCSFSVSKHNKHRVASGGGIYPMDVYIYVNRVKEIQPGFYKYNPYKKCLHKINLKNIEISTLAFIDNIDYKNSNILLFYVYNSYLNKFKYGDAGAVFAILETGMMMQNIQLNCVAMNLGVCDLGGFDEKEILANLNLDKYFGTYVLNMSIIGGNNE